MKLSLLKFIETFGLILLILVIGFFVLQADSPKEFSCDNPYVICD